MSVSENRILRRLAAIVAADVAGYSRLMGADEEGTLRLLTDRRGAMDHLIGQFGGRIANTAGDSVIAEFASVVAAVDCAVAIQRSHAASNSALAPRQRIAFRIGVHLGDVMVKDGDLYGDGVNIAARLEQLAAPGGITLSSRVKEEIAGKLDVRTENLGAFDLKNIARPVEVWRVLPETEGGALHGLRGRMGRYRRALWRRRMAAAAACAGLAAAAVYAARTGADAPAAYELRPFTAPADNEAAKALAGALTNRLADGLGTIPNVRVIVQGGGAAVPGGAARYAVSGSVTPGLASTRVDARIIETATGRVVAATNFSAPPRAPDEMQDEILGAVGDDLSVEINRLRYPRLDTPDAQKALRLADEARNRVDMVKEPARVIALYEEATRLYGDSLDIAGWFTNALIAIATDLPPGSKERADYLLRARFTLAANDKDASFHRLLAYAQCQISNYEHQHAAALAACNRSAQILPFAARSQKEIGTAYMLLGQLERALVSFTQAERFDRRHSVRSIWELKAGLACLLLDKNREAADWLRRAASVGQDDPWVSALAAVAFFRLGDQAASRQEIDAFKRIPADRVKASPVRSIADFYHFQSEALNDKLGVVIGEFEKLSATSS